MITIQGYNFETYPLDSTEFNEVPGIYVIYTSENWLDVGETDKLASRLDGHERESCWRRNASQKTIYVAFRYENNQNVRSQIEEELRTALNPLCGEQ